MKYTINIREILERQIEVDAQSAEEALLIAKSRYDSRKIILAPEDLQGVEIEELLQPCPSNPDEKNKNRTKGELTR